MGEESRRHRRNSKTVNIDETHNVIYEIPTRWEYSDKQVRKLWYTRADIRRSRQEHQEEVMMEQVRVVVEKRLAEEGTPERIDEVMGWPPTMILQYLETPVKKPVAEQKRISISDEDIMDLFSLDISKDLAGKGKGTSSPTSPANGKKAAKDQADDSSSSSSSSSSSDGDDSSSSSSSSSDDSSVSQTDDSDSSSSSSDEDDPGVDADNDTNSSSDSSSLNDAAGDASSKKGKDAWWGKETAVARGGLESSDDDDYLGLDIAPIPPPPPPRSPLPSRSPEKRIKPPKKTDGKTKTSPASSPVEGSTKKRKKKAKTKRRSSSSITDNGNAHSSSVSEESSEEFSSTNETAKAQTDLITDLDSGYHSDSDLAPQTEKKNASESGSKIATDSSPLADQLKAAVQNAGDRPNLKRHASPLAKQFQAAVKNVQVAMAVSHYLEKLGSDHMGLDSSYVPSDDDVELEDEKNKTEECPLCLELIQPGEITRIILVSQLLCKDCLAANENIIRNAEIVVESPAEGVSSGTIMGDTNPVSDKKVEKKNNKKIKKKSSSTQTKTKEDKQVEKKVGGIASPEGTSKKSKAGKSPKAAKKEEKTGKKLPKISPKVSTENDSGAVREKGKTEDNANAVKRRLMENDAIVAKEKGKKKNKDAKSSAAKPKKSKDSKIKDSKNTEKKDPETKNTEVKSSDDKSKDTKRKEKGKDKKKGKKKKTKLDSFDELVKKGEVLGIEPG